MPGPMVRGGVRCGSILAAPGPPEESSDPEGGHTTCCSSRHGVKSSLRWVSIMDSNKSQGFARVAVPRRTTGRMVKEGDSAWRGYHADNIIIRVKVRVRVRVSIRVGRFVRVGVRVRVRVGKALQMQGAASARRRCPCTLQAGREDGIRTLANRSIHWTAAAYSQLA